MEVIKETLILTCSACPTQWEAETNDGRGAYIRYRWGCLTISYNDGNLKPICDINYGDGFDGVLDKDVMIKLLEKEGIKFV